MTVIFAAAALMIVLLVIELMISRPVFTAGVVLGTVAFYTFVSDALPDVVIAGFTVTSSDVVFSLVVAAGAARNLRLERGTVLRRLLTLICVLTLVALVRGVQTYGPETAVREFRTFLYFFGGAWYFASVNPTSERLQRIAKVWLVVAAILVGIAFMRWVALAAGLPPTGVFAREREAGGLRVIDNRSTLIVAQGLLIILPVLLRGQATKWQRRFFFLLIPVLAVLQHRTIWLVLILGAVLILQRSEVLAVEQFAVIIGLGAVVLTLLIMNPGYEEAGLVERSPVDTGSLEWRWNSWVALIADETSGTQWVTGTPFGSGFERELYGRRIDIIPHNWYVEIIYRLGAVGFIPFVAIYVLVIRRWRGWRGVGAGAGAPRLLDRPTFYALLMTQLLYFMFWDPGPEQGLLLGLAMAVGSAPRSTSEPEQDAADDRRADAGAAAVAVPGR